MGLFVLLPWLPAAPPHSHPSPTCPSPPGTTNWPPPGLSLNEADGLFKSLPTIADVRLMKEGLLVLTARLDVPLEECLGMYVTAACDPWDK